MNDKKGMESQEQQPTDEHEPKNESEIGAGEELELTNASTSDNKVKQEAEEVDRKVVMVEEKEEDGRGIVEKDGSEEKVEQEEGGSSKAEEEDELEPVIELLDAGPLYRDPIFAEICSFFNMFTPLFGFKPIPIAKLEKMFCTLVDGDVNRELIDLHVTLMRKIYLKSARADKWEQALLKFCSIAPGLESELRQLQRNNYVAIPVVTKLALLKALCDSQFDCNLKFKENISNAYRHNELRLAPIGIDKRGQLYYFQLDCDLEFRVYSEETEDMAGTSWTLRAKTENELVELIETLRNPDYEVISKEEQEEEEADIDEEQLLDQPKEARKDVIHARPSSSSSNSKLSQLFLDEKEKVQMEGKFAQFWDHYKNADVLNKRKSEKEIRKKQQPVTVSGPTIMKNSSNLPMENENNGMEEIKTEEVNDEEDRSHKKGEENSQTEEDEWKNTTKTNEEEPQNQREKTPELDEALLAEIDMEEQRRRVLPRRSARNTTIQNLKAFGCSPRRQFRNDSEASSTPPIGAKKLGFAPATAGSCSDEESEDNSDDEEESVEDSSDAEFLLDRDEKAKRKTGHPPASKRSSRRKLTVKAKKKKGTPQGKKGKKSGIHQKGNRVGRKSGSSGGRTRGVKKHPTSITFVDEETSEGEEDDDITERELKERKKASEETLCQICNGSKNPELLLLCDSCDTAWHTFCLRPQLWFVPDGDWFCPICEHAILVRRLTYAIVMLREERKASEASKKKKDAADRLKREMDYIGISLNNIIPLTMKNEGNEQPSDWSSSEGEEEGDGERERKSKKRAMKIVMSRTREKRRAEKFYGPVVTIAEGRSRRALNKVDYNFHAYDEQLHDALKIDLDPNDGFLIFKGELNDGSGAGRGKDMQNILEAERKRKIKKEEEEEYGENEGERMGARPAKILMKIEKKGGRKGKKLTDLDIDNATESDTDEWKASSADEIAEDPEPSEDEYLPSERRAAKGIGCQGRHRSDDEFINDDSDSDYYMPSKKKKGSGKPKNKKKQRGRNRKEDYTESDEEEEFKASGSDSDDAPKKKGAKLGKRQTRKWGPRESSSEEEEEESAKEHTETGRPLRRAAANIRKKIIEELEDEEEEEEENGGEDEEKQEAEEQTEGERLADRAVSALTRPKRREIKEEEDADEFKLDEEDEAEADDDEEGDVGQEEEIEEDEEEEAEKESSGEDEEEEETDEETERAPLPFPKKKSTIIKKSLQAGKKKPKSGRNANSKKKSPVKKTPVKQAKTRKSIDNNSMKANIEAEPLPQRRQGLRRQQSAQENAVKESAGDLPTTSNASKKSEEIPSQAKKHFEVTNNGKSEAVYGCETAPSNNRNDESRNAQEAPISSVPSNFGPTLSGSVESSSQTSKLTMEMDSKFPYVGPPVTSASMPFSAMSSPNTKQTVVLQQQVHPQQLSQYFSRPTFPTTGQQRQQQHQQHSQSAPAHQPISNTTTIEARFQSSHNPATTSFAYAVPPHSLHSVNGVPPVTAPPHPAGLIASHSQFPPAVSAIPPFATSQPQSAAYFIQTNGAPQIVYQTLQPFVSLPSHLQQHQQTSATDPDGSLSHALAGAMNPEDL